MTQPDPRFETWLAALRSLAQERDLAWIAASVGETHREAFDAGTSPADYLDTYERMAEWRGCGCGGG